MVQAIIVNFAPMLFLTFQNTYGITFSSLLCVIRYFLASLSDNVVFSFIGLALCGFSVGIMWPGTLSIGAAEIKGGGTAMFALFALAGDVGCSAGPAVVGLDSKIAGNMKTGILIAAIFPILLVLALLAKNLLYRNKKPCII